MTKIERTAQLIKKEIETTKDCQKLWSRLNAIICSRPSFRDDRTAHDIWETLFDAMLIAEALNAIECGVDIGLIIKTALKKRTENIL